MRKFTYITCPICGKEFQSLGYASHRAMHRRERERAKKLQQPPVSINEVSVCDCIHIKKCFFIVTDGKCNKGCDIFKQTER